MRKKGLVLLLMIILLSSGCGSALSGELTVLKAAQDFTAVDIKGNKVTLSEYKGKIILLNFFATWCPPCRSEMPDFDKISKEEKDVMVIGINVGNEDKTQLEEFIRLYGLGFTVIKDDGNITKLYGPIRGIPVTYVIDKDFNIVKQYVGARPGAVFRQDIEKIRKQKKT